MRINGFNVFQTAFSLFGSSFPRRLASEVQKMSSWLKRFLVGVAVLPALAMATSTTPSYPVYKWHTFFGGEHNSGANLPATAVDAAGNLYVTGPTQYPW